MNEKQIRTLFDILDNWAIEIPRIQRDYVQGRSGHVESNRNQFVQKLVTSLKDNENCHLNFIYGYLAGNRFVPIDGQQRLTTLYLLAYYLFLRSGKSLSILKEKLCYETRETTQRFLNQLLQFEWPKRWINIGVSKFLKDQSWYSFLWDYDPSIQSFLAVLDTIQKYTDNINENHLREMADRIYSHDSPITFEFLLLDEKKEKPNELYIKMNARGKQLTPFENFKAELYAFAEDNLKMKQIEDYKRKMDGDWYDFLWNYFPKENNDDKDRGIKIDTLFKAVIDALFLNRIPELVERKEWNGQEAYLSEYIDQKKLEDQIKIVSEVWLDLKNLLDLSSNGKEGELFERKVLDDLLPKTKLFSLTYENRCLLFVLTLYLRYGKDIAQHIRFYRTARNLITNCEIDNILKFKNAIGQIVENKETATSLLQAVKEDGKWLQSISTKESWNEEGIKQTLIERDKNWEKIIIEAEEGLPYFNGEIGFLFHMAMDKSNNFSIERFTDYVQVMKKLFPKQNGSMDSEGKDYFLHRLLLTYDNYYITKGSKKNDTLYCYCVEWDQHHKYDWRGYLRQNPPAFREMLDEYIKSKKEFEEFAKEKIKAYKTDSNPSFCSVMVQNPEPFSYIHKGMLVRNYDNSYYFLTTKNRKRGINFLLFEYYLDKKRNGENPAMYDGKDNDGRVECGGKVIWKKIGENSLEQKK